MKFFSNFGKLEKISLKKRSEALICFKEYLSAFLSQKLLDNVEVKEVDAKLHVKFCDQLDESIESFVDVISILFDLI